MSPTDAGSLPIKGGKQVLKALEIHRWTAPAGRVICYDFAVKGWRNVCHDSCEELWHVVIPIHPDSPLWYVSTGMSQSTLDVEFPPPFRQHLRNSGFSVFWYIFWRTSRSSNNRKDHQSKNDLESKRSHQNHQITPNAKKGSSNCSKTPFHQRHQPSLIFPKLIPDHGNRAQNIRVLSRDARAFFIKSPRFKYYINHLSSFFAPVEGDSNSIVLHPWGDGERYSNIPKTEITWSTPSSNHIRWEASRYPRKQLAEHRPLFRIRRAPP